MTQDEIVQSVLKELGAKLAGLGSSGVALKTVSGPTVPPNHIYGHGAGGLFNTPCVDRGLFSAMSLPRSGLAGILPVFPSQNDNPQVGIITGVTATDEDHDSNDAITGECGRGPSAGKLKYCVINDYPFGDYSRSMSAINIRKAGRMACRTDTFDYGVMGNPFNSNSQPNGSVPGFPGLATIGNVANNEASKALFELGVAWSRDLAKDLYTGNPAAAFEEWSKPFRGLDLLINDGYSDMVSGNLCTRVDSFVKDFSDWVADAGNDIETHSSEIIQAIVETTALLYRRASLMGLEPIRMALAMPYNLFRKLTYLWPCSYYTGWCTPATGYTNTMSVEAQMRLTQEMQDGQYLLVGGSYNGGRLPVVIDDAITETTHVMTNQLSCSIYWVTTHIFDRVPVTYMQYFDYNGNQGAMEVANMVGQGRNYGIYDAGRFLAHFIAPEGTCVQISMYTEPRVRVDTPFLCARLDAIHYTPYLAANESPFPEDPTFLNGGNFGPNPGAPGTCATISAASGEAGALTLTISEVINCADAPFNTNIQVTLEDGTVLFGYIVSGGTTTSPVITFNAPLQSIAHDFFDLVGAKICCAFGDSRLT